MAPTPDDRSPLAIAAAWANIAITVSLEMAVPCLIGYAADVWLGIKPLLTAIGALLGLFGGMLHLIRLAGPRAGDHTRRNGQT